MDGVERQIGEKRFILIRLDKGNGFVGQALREGLPI
jgi:hypothetical protein